MIRDASSLRRAAGRSWQAQTLIIQGNACFREVYLTKFLDEFFHIWWPVIGSIDVRQHYSPQVIRIANVLRCELADDAHQQLLVPTPSMNTKVPCQS